MTPPSIEHLILSALTTDLQGHHHYLLLVLAHVPRPRSKSQAPAVCRRSTTVLLVPVFEIAVLKFPVPYGTTTTIPIFKPLPESHSPTKRSLAPITSSGTCTCDARGVHGFQLELDTVRYRAVRAVIRFALARLHKGRILDM